MATESLVDAGISVDREGNIHREGEIGYDPTSPLPLGGSNYKSKYCPKTSERSISGDMEDVSLPQKFKLKADEIFKKSRVPTRRGKRRRMLVFCCLLLAYKELDEIEFPEIIARELGMDRKDISKSLSMEEYFPDYDISSIKYAPEDFIPKCVSIINSTMMVSVSSDDVMVLAKRVLDSDKALREMFPQNIALGIVMYYMDTRGIEYSQSAISTNFYKSITTLQSLCASVANADNHF